MNKNKGGGSVLGDFELGSKGNPVEEAASQEGVREAELQKFDSLVDALRESERGELAAYLGLLSGAQREKIDSELNMISGDLKWVQPDQQNKAIEILGEIDGAANREEQIRARNRLSELLG